MAFSHSALTVKTNGQTLLVTAYRYGSTSATVPLHLTSAVASAVTQPYAISADTTFYIPDDHAGFWVVSAKQRDGSELWGQEECLGSGEKVVSPLPSAAQVAADTGGRLLALAPTGALAETFPRAGATLVNSAMLSTGRLSMVAIDLPASRSITSITFRSSTTALSGGSNQWFALYDSSLVLLRQTVDDGATAWAANSAKTLTLTTPYTTTYSGLHYVGINVTASTVPTVIGATGNGVVSQIVPILSATSSTSLTDTAPNPAAALSGQTTYPWAYVS